MDREQLIKFATFLDEGCDLLGEGYIEAKTDEWLQKIANDKLLTKQTETKHKTVTNLTLIS